MAEDKNGNGRVSLGRRKSKPTKKPASGTPKKEEEEDEDADEETYCVCGGVSWGTMVACDNPDVSFCVSFAIRLLTAQCEREWFHISCVGLSRAPDKNATWYCPDCKDKPRRSRRK
jgi:hypothetical protein